MGKNQGTSSRSTSRPFSQAEYEALAGFRYHLARFLRRRKDAARSEGLQSQQYEMLLAVAGLSRQSPPTIKEIAAQFRLQHHTIVELTDRMERQGFLKRRTSVSDKRVVLLDLTPSGRAVLARIVRCSLSQLPDEAPALIQSLQRILHKQKRV